MDGTVVLYCTAVRYPIGRVDMSTRYCVHTCTHTKSVSGVRKYVRKAWLLLKLLDEGNVMDRDKPLKLKPRGGS